MPPLHDLRRLQAAKDRRAEHAEGLLKAARDASLAAQRATVQQRERCEQAGQAVAEQRLALLNGGTLQMTALRVALGHGERLAAALQTQQQGLRQAEQGELRAQGKERDAGDARRAACRASSKAQQLVELAHRRDRRLRSADEDRALEEAGDALALRRFSGGG